MVAGDKVIVTAGTYAEKVTTSNNGTANSRITYEADISAGDVIIDGQGKDNCFSLFESIHYYRRLCMHQCQRTRDNFYDNFGQLWNN